jgi:GAF domain-containing protein
LEPTHAESDRLTPIQALAELHALLSGDLDAEVVLDRIASLSRRTIPQADQVSVTLMDGDEAWTAVFTGDIARHLDERQYDVGYGPCTDAALSGRTIPVALRSPDTTYPEFCRAGQGLGILNTLSVAMPAPDRVIGGINFYSTSEQPFDPEAVELAEVFAS